MGSTRIQTPPAPPPPAQIDYAAESARYIEAMANPALQQQIIDAERQFRPQYVDLEIADINRYGGALNQLQAEASRSQSQIAIDAQRQQREADISDVERFGARASQAFMSANPELRAQMERNRSLQGGPVESYEDYVRSHPDLLSNWENNASKNTQLSIEEYGRQHYEQSGRSEGRTLPTRNQSNGVDMAGLHGAINGPLAQLLQQQAMQAGGLGAVGDTLDQRAQMFAQSTGQLNQDELRNLQQSVRGAYAARGTEMGSGAISAEALGRLTNERQRMQEDIMLAQQLQQGNLNVTQANRGFQQGVHQQDIAARGGLAQLQQGQLDSQRGYGLQLSQQQAAVASDPFQAILGRQSTAPNLGMASTQYAGGLAGQGVGPNLFDPNAGINLGLQQQANQTNYLANIYGSQAGVAGANAQAAGAKSAGMMQAGGSIVGAGLAAGGMASLIAF